MNTLINLQLLTVQLIYCCCGLKLFIIYKGLKFVLKSSTVYNIDFIYRKKASELNFCSKLKRYLNDFNTSICFQKF